MSPRLHHPQCPALQMNSTSTGETDALSPGGALKWRVTTLDDQRRQREPLCQNWLLPICTINFYWLLVWWLLHLLLLFLNCWSFSSDAESLWRYRSSQSHSQWHQLARALYKFPCSCFQYPPTWAPGWSSTGPTVSEQAGEAEALPSRQGWPFRETLESQRCKHCYVPGNLGSVRRDHLSSWNIRAWEVFPKERLQMSLNDGGTAQCRVWDSSKTQKQGNFRGLGCGGQWE